MANYIRSGFYFDENGKVVDLKDINDSLKAILLLDEYPKVLIENNEGFTIGEYCYYVNELEVKLIQAGFTFKSYPGQEGDYFYIKEVKSLCVYAEDGDNDLIEFMSPLSKNLNNGVGELQISYVLDEDGHGIDFSSEIELDSEYGIELLERAGVQL